MAQKMNVALLFGGRSGEHEVSLVSAASVYKALDKNLYNITLIGIDPLGRWVIPSDAHLLENANEPRTIDLRRETTSVALIPYKTPRPLIDLTSGKILPIQIDVAIPILHGTYGEDGTIQGLLELAQIPYVGSGVAGSSVGMDKDLSRRLMASVNIPVVPTLTVTIHEFKTSPEEFIKKAVTQLGLPFFVKPANSGSSVGVNKVKSVSEAMEKFQDAFSFDIKVLVEKSIPAREIECAVLGNHHPQASIVGEIIPTHEFYSYEAKYLDQNGALLKIPADNVTPAQVETLRSLSIAAFKALELRGMARVDFFLDRENGKIYLNEVNTIPGFTSISMYPKMWQASGLAYPKLLDELIRLAVERKEERESLRTSYQS